MNEFETTGRVDFGLRRASGPFVRLRARADDLSITTPIGSIALGPREVVALRPLKSLFGSGGFEIVHTRDGRKVVFRCRDADAVRQRILDTGFVPSGTPGGGPDPARAALHAAEDRADHGRLMKIFGVVAIVLAAIAVVLKFAIPSLADSDAYRDSWATLRADPRVADVTGTPVTRGSPSGSIQLVRSDGHATLRYDVAGPRGRGTAEVEATELAGRWHIDRLVFEPEGPGAKSIDLSGPR